MTHTTHRSHSPTGTCVQAPYRHNETVKGKRITVTSPALERWQVALILGVSERTVKRWESNNLTAERFGRSVRYPADINGLSKYIELVEHAEDATPHP